jgi:hypothetical protein
MRKRSAGLIYRKLEYATRKWWFYLLLIAIPALIPNITASGLIPWREILPFGHHMSDTLIARRAAIEPLMPVLHVLMALLVIALLYLGNRFAAGFSVIVGIHFLFVTFIQNAAMTERYGFSIVTCAFIWFLLIAVGWAWEARAHFTDFTLRQIPKSSYWVIPMAVFAYWDPDTAWQFDPSLLLTSTSPSAFCMITPIYLAVLILYFPRVNLPLFRVMSFIGLIITVFIAYTAVIREPSEGIYWMVLHLPMLCICLYCFVIGLREKPAFPQPA